LGEGWPKAANALSGRLKRAAPALRKAGIAIEWPARHDGPKIVNIRLANTYARKDRPDRPDHPPKEANSNIINNLSESDPDDPRPIPDDPRPISDDLVPTLEDRGSDDHESPRTIPVRSLPQLSSGFSALKTRANSPVRADEDVTDDPYGPLSNSGTAYPDELAQGDDDIGNNEDDGADGWHEGRRGIL
jgi:hypothetical protein